MLVIFYGTSAELIKMLGIVRSVPRNELLLICSAQQNQGLKKVHAQLSVQPDIYLSRGWRGQDVTNMKQMAGMMLLAHLNFIIKFRAMRSTFKRRDAELGTTSVAVVHGDTLTTVIGTYMGKVLGLPVAHVEAGLRSGAWNNPFPEELDRRFASRLARIHFAPNAQAVGNLRRERVKGVIVDTIYNTAKDAIELSDRYVSEEYARLGLPKRYGLVLLHRTELLESRADLEAIIKLISNHASPDTPMVFTEHSTTRAKIEAYGLSRYMQKPGMIVIPKQPYFDFMAIVKRAAYIITDGGGLQEDAYFFSIPTIVHRRRTERQEGIGLNAELSGMQILKVEAFLDNNTTKKPVKNKLTAISPSSTVVDWFRQHGYISQKRPTQLSK